ncbi:iron-only hydrogenase system regulator [Clostridium sp. D2Q-14]|uniref:TM1266 family iron-only hydrogenase system putative regulator n=1 Tax=Anaeromonas gelatinilytica TaxID=2683194 RepID=UPI00193B2D78|nr:TM1266 family iron-only hydrogenase system putative regulator [Anaeromonas gelatinilytica]MBS4534029.1 iron-only hydrogenase system regulator [Anaeromonas gelatinilytica]
MKKIAVIGAVLDEPKEIQKIFNNIISEYSHIIRGRMGLPFESDGISVISLTVLGELDEINSLTGKLGNIPHVSVKTSISKKEIK